MKTARCAHVAPAAMSGFLALFALLAVQPGALAQAPTEAAEPTAAPATDAAQAQPPVAAEVAPETPPPSPEAATSMSTDAPTELSPVAVPLTEAAPTDLTVSTAPTAPASKLPSYVMWGLGGASLVAGAVLGATALSAKSDYNANPTYDAADRVEGRAVAADVLLGIGAVLAITGTVFYFSIGAPDAGQADKADNAKAQPPRATVQVAPMIGAQVAGAKASLRF